MLLFNQIKITHRMNSEIFLKTVFNIVIPIGVCVVGLSLPWVVAFFYDYLQRKKQTKEEKARKILHNDFLCELDRLLA